MKLSICLHDGSFIDGLSVDGEKVFAEDAIELPRSGHKILSFDIHLDPTELMNGPQITSQRRLLTYLSGHTLEERRVEKHLGSNYVRTEITCLTQSFPLGRVVGPVGIVNHFHHRFFECAKHVFCL